MNGEFLLQVRDLSKSFPGVKALDGVHLDVRKGEVHAVTGENGAGKSTLMKILAGLHEPDAGEIRLRGREVRIRSPYEALRLGISMIHQELLPFPDLSVAENICMGQEPTRRLPGWLDKPAMRRSAAALLDRLGVSIAPETRMRELSVAEMQTVEIAKALACRAGVIIMDEPTSAISEREVDALAAVIADLRRQAVSVIYISHRMEEIFRFADTVTVLRDGRHVATRPAGSLDQDSLIALMVGRELAAAAPAGAAEPGEVALEVRRLTRRGRFSEASFTVRRGEILGIAGLMGAGRTDLVSALFGLAPADSGEILVNGRPLRIRTPCRAIAGGIGMVSEDRKIHGLVPEMTVKHNVTLASLEDCCRGPLIDRRRESRLADSQIRSLSIRTPDRNRKVKHLSGGNQQKVVIARALLADPSILILDEPTRGIDIGAKAEIYTLMRRLAAQGKAIIMVSSEMTEILSLSDRILVMCGGAIRGEFDPRSATPEQIMSCAMPD